MIYHYIYAAGHGGDGEEGLHDLQAVRVLGLT